MEFLIGLAIGLGVAVFVYLNRTKIKTSLEADLAKAKSDLTTAVAKLPKQ